MKYITTAIEEELSRLLPLAIAGVEWAHVLNVLPFKSLWKTAQLALSRVIQERIPYGGSNLAVVCQLLDTKLRSVELAIEGAPPEKRPCHG